MNVDKTKILKETRKDYFWLEIISVAIVIMFGAMILFRVILPSFSPSILDVILYDAAIIMGLIESQAASIIAGDFCRRYLEMGGTEDLNKKYHRYFVIMMNGTIGITFTGYCYCNFAACIVPLISLAVFMIIYGLTFFLRIIKPNSFLARFRSVIVRLFFSGVIFGSIWSGYGYLVIGILSIPVLIFSWRHLSKDQKKFGWNFR